MDFKISQYAIYSSGQRIDAQGHPLQEDCIYPPLGHASPADRLFIVCDGMGGSGYGLYASSTVCRSISRYIEALPSGSFSQGDMDKAIEAAFDELDRAERIDTTKMGTTLAVLKLYADGYIAAHIGDSRIYHIRPGLTPALTRILWRSHDHTLANYLVRNGKMSPQEALTSSKRHVLTRALQPHMQKRCRADIHASADVRAGDYFMVCSDGMLEHITDEYLCAIFSAEGGSDKNKAAILTKASNDNIDNHSAIIVHITEVIDVSKASENSNVPKKKEKMDKKLSDKAAKVSDGVRDFVNRRKANGDTAPLVIKFVFALMGVLAVIMFVYYAFVRTDETLQTAGTAQEQVSVDDTETYGYEITEQDIRNEAQLIAPEVEETEPDEEIEIDPLIEEPDHPASQEPEAPSDEPILQE